MKLHLPVGLLMTVLAASSVSMTEAKTFSTRKNITNYWKQDDTRIHLSFVEAIGRALGPDMQWAIDIRLTDLLSYGYTLSTLQDGSGSAGAGDFKIDFDLETQTVTIQGYGWEGGAYTGAQMGGSISNVFSLVHMGRITEDQQVLSKSLYGVWPANTLNSSANPVGFYPRGAVSQDGGAAAGERGTMYNATTKANGPGSGWGGITDLYGYWGTPTNPTGWWDMWVTYTYDADEMVGCYTIGGAGKLTQGESSSQTGGGCGVFQNYGEGTADGDVYASEQVTGDVKELFGNGESTMYFMAGGTNRELNDGDLKAGESSKIREAGNVVADFNLYLKGIQVREGTGNYTLIAPNVRFADDALLSLREGGGSTFTITTEGEIQWDGDRTFDIAEGKTLRLQGKGGRGLGITTLKGGGKLFLSDGTILGDEGNITISDGSTLDFNNQKLQGEMRHTIYLRSGWIGDANYGTKGANLAGARNVQSGVRVEAKRGGSFNLGGLNGQYLSVAQFDDVGSITGIGGGTTVTIGEDDFRFWVDENNLTHAASRSASVSGGGTYLMQFQNSGNLDFSEYGKVQFMFTNGAIKKVQGLVDGYMDLWFSNGSFEIDLTTLRNPNELLAWFQKHFDLEAGMQIREVDIKDIIEGEPGKNGGILRLLISADGIWMASKHGDPISADYINEVDDEGNAKWKQVRVDADMTIEYDPEIDSETQGQGNITLRNVSSGEGQGSLTVKNKNEESLTLTIEQSDPYCTGVLRGDIILAGEEEERSISLKKTGDAADLHITGNLQGADDLAVDSGKLIIDGYKSDANTLSQVNGELQLNGMLTLKKQNDSLLTGNGTISGAGMLHLEGGALNMGGVGLGVDSQGAAVGIWLDKKEGEEEYAELTTKGDDIISGIRGGDGHGKGGTLTLGGGLTIDNTNSNTGASDFSGTISMTGGTKTITVQNKGTEQMLRSSGNSSVDLAVKDGAFLSLAGGEDEVDEVGINQKIAYGNVTVGEDDDEAKSVLTVQAQDFGKDYAAVTSLNVDSLTVNADAQLNVLYNLAAANDDLQGSGVASAIKGGSVIWDSEATLGLGTVGVNLYDVDDPHDLKDFVVAEGVTLSEGDKVKFELGGSFLIYWRDVTVTYKDGQILLNAKAINKNRLLEAANGASNPIAGADLLWEARKSAPMGDPSITKINALMTWMAYNYKDHPGEVCKALAAAAGSTVPIMGSAQRDALRNQLIRIRDHSGFMGLSEEYTYTELPYVHFWVEATGDFNKLDDDDGCEPGYNYNAWGGTVGLEMDMTATASVAAGITALYGTIDGGNADRADGNLDSYYLSVMGRFQHKRWGHTVVGVIGLNEAKMDRTVIYPGGGYSTHGSTNGYSAGLMYEATYDIYVKEDRTSMVQPLVNFSLMKTALKGYDEHGQEGQGVGLNVGDQDWVTATIGLGARWIGVVGESGFNRPAQLEVRANIAQDLGDSQGEAAVALQANPSVTRTVRAAEVGKTALQLGTSLRVPLNEQTLLYFNVNADLRDAMTSWNLGAGVRYDF